MHVYEDPSDPTRRRPSLIGGLIRCPTTRALSPEENQFTEALAWLLDRSASFARRFAALFLSDDVALSALARAKSFGARTQIALPSPNGKGVVWPDLCLAGDDRTFDLLVEVKIGSEPHEYLVADQVLLQPDLYIAAWALRPAVTQAEVRRVGTLTTGFPFAQAASSERAADVNWESVRGLLEELLASDGIGEAAPVAADYLLAIDERILKRVQMPPAEHVARLLDDGALLLNRIYDGLAGSIGARKRAGPHRRERSASLYIQVARPDDVESEYELGLRVTPEGAEYNVYGRPDLLSVSLYERHEVRFKDETRVLSGGFSRVKDLAGYVRDALLLDLPSDEGRIVELDVIARDAQDAIVAALRSCDPPLA